MSKNNKESNLLSGKFGKGSAATPLAKDSKAKADKLLSKLMDEDLPQNTGGYSMVQVLTTGGDLDTVPDLLSSRNRHRRWGVMFSIAVIPGLDKVPPGPITIPNTPMTFFDADSLDDLRERLVYEVDKAIETSKLSKDDPEAFAYVQKEFTSRLQTLMASANDTPVQN